MRTYWHRNLFPLFGLLAIVAGIAPLYYLYPSNPDIAVYDYIGLVVNQSGKPYQDAADQNWPGQMLVHVASVALFGSDLKAYRIFELLFILPISCLIIALSLNKIYSRTAALISIPVYVAMYTTAGYWSTGQREIVASPLLVGAATLLFMRINGSGNLTLLAQGILISTCTLIRPTLLIILPLLALADILMMRLTNRPVRKILMDQLIVSITVIMTLALSALLADFYEILDDWLDASILFNINVYGGGRDIKEILLLMASYAWDSWRWYIVWCAIGAIFLVRQNIVAAILIATLIPATIISVVVQGKGFIYHFAVIYPLFAILVSVAMAAGVDYLKSKLQPVHIRLVATILVCLPILGLSKKVWSTFSLQRSVLSGNISPASMYDQYTAGEFVTIGDVIRAADYINSQKSESTTLLVWGRPCHVYNLTGLKSPLFAASFALLDEPTPDFKLFDKWYQHVERTFVDAPPEFLLLIKNPSNGGYQHIHDEDGTRRISDVIRDSLPRYQHDRSFANLEILKLIN